MDPEITTANRYVGWYQHGDIKIRGIEARRRDTPKFIKTMQSEMLNRMSGARNVEEVRALAPDLLEIVRGAVALLRSGKANPMDLVLRRHITKEADEYTNNSISAVVAKLVQEMGVPLAAGESIEFIIIDQSGKKRSEKAKPFALYAFEDGYDIEQYTELTLKAAETLLFPFGYDVQSLKDELGLMPPAPKKASRRTRQLHAASLESARQIPLFRMRTEQEKEQ
jgi:DNA polymerase-2